jgi:hypothetical protein
MSYKLSQIKFIKMGANLAVLCPDLKQTADETIQNGGLPEGAGR